MPVDGHRLNGQGVFVPSNRRHSESLRRPHGVLGDEAPLVPEGVRRGLPDRREISGRWLAATFVTGFAGFGLMGGALWAAVDGESRIAIDPNPARAAFLRPTTEAVDPRTRKGDRLPPRVVVAPTRQILQVATATRVGDREVVRTRPFARISAGLVMDRSAISANIPPFNPLRIFQEAGQPQRASPQPALLESEGEMSMAVRAIDSTLGPFADEDRVPTPQILALVRQTALVEASSGTGQSLPDLLLQRADPSRNLRDGSLSAFAATPSGESVFARVTNENVTAVAKTEATRTAVPGAQPNDERVIIVQRGQSLATILVENGASLAEARSIIEALSRRFRPTDLREGQRVRIAIAPVEAGQTRRQILRVAVVTERQVLATAVLSDQSQFVAIDATLESLEQLASSAAEAEEEEEEAQPERTTPSLYASIYETALRQNIPRRLIDQLIRIYAYDFDFQRRVRPGDSFEVFYSADEEMGGTVDRDDILYASLTVGGETRRYFRFQTEDDGVVDYFDERGRSAKKFLLRTPLNGGTFRSGFGMRRHPLLGYSRLHSGVDWSAPVGTPIVAAGAGTITKAAWDSGYGRRVEIQHSNGYMTTYSHLSGFARGSAPGARVYQGQVIGFLGSSGLSTGPHLHYEVLVNGSFVDPMRIRVPRGRTLEGRFLAEFERERTRVEQMMRRDNGTARVAQVN
jgi:murein DD-endopeptidase MepM/ murein hydrolase activator NlpD